VADLDDLERRLMAACVRDLARLLKFTGGARHAFYFALLTRYPLNDLKALLRMRAAQSSESLPGAASRELPPGLELPPAVAEAEDVEELVGRIPFATVRGRVVAALPAWREAQTAAVLEMAVNQGYWQAVREALGRLGPVERGRCAEAVEAECEAARVLAVLRAGRTYAMPWEMLAPLMPPAVGRGLSTSALRRLHADPSAETLRSVAPWTGVEDVEDIGDVGERLWSRTLRTAARQFRAGQDGITALIGYYYAKRGELRHLLGLTQMLRYGRSAEEILAFLEV